MLLSVAKVPVLLSAVKVLLLLSVAAIEKILFFAFHSQRKLSVAG